MKRLLLPVAGALAVVAAGVIAFVVLREATPEQVAEGFLKARYVNDAPAIYALASSGDQRYRSREEYLAANPEFPSELQGLVDALLGYLVIESVAVEDGSAAASDASAESVLVTIRGQVPNAGDPGVDALLNGSDPATERLAELRRQGRADSLPLHDFVETVELRREADEWRVFMDWASVYTIEFGAVVKDDLPYAFTVEPTTLRLRPGETGVAMFHATNLSDRTITAKAGHVFDPPIAQLHTELIQCFCFFQDTLAPGESKDLPLVFRLGWDMPADFTEISVVYEYYPLESFLDRRE